ncbi:MAG TPA: AMP-binding protein [Acidimicrobiia bacterium]|nr:AMP-binding protein [Acidimicrobiia bacterium]
MPGWSFAAVWAQIAAEVPDRDALVCGARRRTWGEFEDRAARLASHLHGVGVRAGDSVAIDMTNRIEYLETFFAALRLGAQPVNVNYRYLAEEVHYVLADSGAGACVHGEAFGPVVGEAAARFPAGERPALLAVGDAYEAALAAASPDGPWRDRPPDGDDVILLYTGGTTGMPKGVRWRNDDLYVALWELGRPGTEPPDPVAAARAGKRTGTALPACPLMHGTGLFMAMTTLSGGGTVVLIDEPGLDAARVWSEVERERVAVLTIVGDVFARPLLAVLDEQPGFDLSSLRTITSSGVTFSPDAKAGLLAHLPDVTLIDSLGASEGLMSRTAARAGSDLAPARFGVSARVQVLDEDTGRPVEPGSGAVGLLAVRGRLPLGYLHDEAKTAATFRVLDGVRYAIPGDYATVDADGTIQLLGRGSACINTGGEKVYPEEVELVLRAHPGVEDVVVVGVADARFGEMVVALVVPRAGTDADDLESDLVPWCRDRIAGYKRPKRFFVVGSLERAASGKANYPRLRERAAALAGP